MENIKIFEVAFNYVMPSWKGDRFYKKAGRAYVISESYAQAEDKVKHRHGNKQDFEITHITTISAEIIS